MTQPVSSFGSREASRAPASALAPGSAGPPGSEPRVLLERPPAGLARGELVVPSWVIGSLGVVVVLVGLGYLLMKALKS